MLGFVFSQNKKLFSMGAYFQKGFSPWAVFTSKIRLLGIDMLQVRSNIIPGTVPFPDS